MEVVLEFAIAIVYHGLGRLIFGKSFDTGEVVPFWKKIFLVVITVAFAYALFTSFFTLYPP